MTPEQELAHLTAPSEDPKQRMIDYWGRRAERAEAEAGRLELMLSWIATYDPEIVARAREKFPRALEEK